MDSINKAIELLGGLNSLAAALGRTPQQVSNWRMRDQVPAVYCPDIERVTKGAVTCEELRPDINWAVLRRPYKAAA